MKHLITIVALCIGGLMAVNAQTFTQRIQKKGKTGEGTLTVTHDKAIDELVNKQGELPIERKVTETYKKTTEQPTTPVQRKTDDKTAKPDTATIEPQMPDNQRKVMVGGVKINGYRVQAFAGGNSRADRQKAEQVGNLLKSHFPNEPVYVHFYSPRWICRMGNYRTMEEAHEMLSNVRKIGITGASIVKGKITVKY
ncbi:MAG: SPOR domain-containing protein [Prevotella sp.]|nr:SPOR domain-containing protein [Prevotella sp.]